MIYFVLPNGQRVRINSQDMNEVLVNEGEGVEGHSIKKKVDDKRMKEKCSNSLAFGVGGNGEKKLAKVVWRISCNEHNNNNVGDFSRLFVENKIKINEKQSVFDCCCVVYRAKAGGWRGGGTLREKWKKKNKKKSLFDYGFDLEKWLEGGKEGCLCTKNEVEGFEREIEDLK